jgi:hypothetical protein
VVKVGLFAIQVCVPRAWKKSQIENFANASVLCGTSKGWRMRTAGQAEKGDKVRQPCAKRANCVHVVLDA